MELADALPTGALQPGFMNTESDPTWSVPAKFRVALEVCGAGLVHLAA